MKLSVIIPALNEEKVISSALWDLAWHRPDEVIVADGGSRDQTVKLALERATVVYAPKGRARQMNAGAASATGDILLFLHADTRLPQGGLDLIREAVLKGARAGRFRMQFDRRDGFLRFYESYTRFHLFSYGDQGFFVTRELFHQIGGYREEVPFEDVDFYRRLRRHTRPVILKRPVVTSARRFDEVGPVKQKVINLLLVGLAGAGFNILPLKERLYPDVR